MEETKDIENKQYNNAKIQSIIESMIPKDKYGEYTSLVNEIILRRAYTFDLSEEQITRDINTMLENCKSIDFSDSKDLPPKTMGKKYFYKKSVAINYKYFEKKVDYDTMFEVLTHEMYHAMSEKSTDKGKKYTGLEFIDENGLRFGTALNEVFNEYAAHLASYSSTVNDEKRFYNKTMGYPNLTYVVPILATAIGVSVKDLVKAGINSREELMDFMSSKIPESERENFAKDFGTFEFTLNDLRRLESKDTSKLTDEEKDDIEKAHTKISIFAMKSLHSSIINDKRPLTKELQEEYEYRRDATSRVIDSFCSHSSKKRMLPDAVGRMAEEINSKIRAKTNSLIIGLNHIFKISDMISEEEKKELLANMKENYSSSKYKSYAEFEKKLIGSKGIEPFYPSHYKVSDVRIPIDVSDNSYRRKIRQQNYDDFKKWDNTAVNDKLKIIYEKYLAKREASKETEVNENKGTGEVTPKQIAICDQTQHITKEEVENAKSLIEEMLMMEDEKETNINDGR